MKIRSRARGWALQVLYAWEAQGRAAALEQVYTELVAERRIATASRAYVDELVRTIGAHLPEIDRAITQALTNWRLERLAAIDRNVLRIGAAEILFLADVPPRVSIREAIRLAEKYGTPDSPRFVNGVLDALMRQAAGGTG